MGTFSDLPRYPTHPGDEADGPSEFDGAVRGAVTVAQVAGELLFLATPLFAIAWWIVCLPILLALILATAARSER